MDSIIMFFHQKSAQKRREHGCCDLNRQKMPNQTFGFTHLLKLPIALNVSRVPQK